MSIGLVVWVGVVTFALIAIVIVQLLAVRLIDAARRRSREAFEREWMPVLYRAMESVPESLPAVAERDALTFLSAWNRLQESVLGDAKERLNELARRVGMVDVARRLLADRGLSARLLGIATLGQLREPSVREQLLQLTTDQDLSVSLAASRALVQIDPHSAVEPLLALVAARDDWPPSAVVRILQEAGPEVVSGPLARAALGTAPEHVHRLIRYLGLTHSESSVPVVRQLLRQADNVETITACLRVFNDATDLETVRGFLHHPRWEVRVQAVNALGRLGTTADEACLVPLLSDKEWWVRYRAAQALCALPSADLVQLERMGEALDDRYARDIMTHVLSERRAA